MARGRRDGILIAGGGLAGSLAALAMARHRPEVPLLIVEERETFGGEGYRSFLDAELDEEGAALVKPLVSDRWPGFYVAFPGFSRKLKAGIAGFGAEDLHRAMVQALKPKAYRLGTKVVAVREDALVLDGGETIKAEGAIDARGPTAMSTLDLLYETRLERDYRFAAPHRVDRPVLVDATVAQHGGLRFFECLPLSAERLLVAEVTISERAQPDAEAGARIAAYVKARGWGRPRATGERAASRPLPTGGDFAAFWRLGGARAAKLGLRGGFVHPVTGRTLGDAAAMAPPARRAARFFGPCAPRSVRGRGQASLEAARIPARHHRHAGRGPARAARRARRAALPARSGHDPAPAGGPARPARPLAHPQGAARLGDCFQLC